MTVRTKMKLRSVTTDEHGQKTLRFEANGAVLTLPCCDAAAAELARFDIEFTLLIAADMAEIARDVSDGG